MTMLKFVTYVTYLIPLALILLILYVLIRMPLTRYKVALLGYLITCLSFVFLGELLGRKLGNNLILIPLFGVLELGWFSYIYYTHTQNKLFLYSTIPAFTLLVYELSTTEFHALQQLQSYTRSVAALSLFLLTLYYSYQLIKNKWQTYNAFFFLFHAAVLVYFAFTCLYYLPLQLLITGNRENILLFWLINSIITLLFYLLTTTVLCKITSKMNTSS